MSNPGIIKHHAVTLATHDMARAVRFYRMLGLKLFAAVIRARSPAFGWTQLPRSRRPARRATVVVVGAGHFYHSDVTRCTRRRRGRPSSGHGATRCRIGGTVLSLTDPDGPELALLGHSRSDAAASRTAPPPSAEIRSHRATPGRPRGPGNCTRSRSRSDLTLSRHPARAIARRLPPSAKIGSLPVDRVTKLDGDDLLPSLHGVPPLLR